MRKAIFLAVLLAGAAVAHAADPIKIGLVAALSGPSAQSGEAITRGLTVAIDEINAKGGVLGRKLELVRRDDESSPPKGVSAARELIYQ
jgi:branched-chain amino acid transport system substrate-binding protein